MRTVPMTAVRHSTDFVIHVRSGDDALRTLHCSPNKARLPDPRILVTACFPGECGRTNVDYAGRNAPAPLTEICYVSSGATWK